MPTCFVYGFFPQVEPSVRVRSVEAAGSKHPGMLVCSVYGFYPKQIRVAWLRNGKEVTSEVTSTEELPNGNWLYQMHSYLEFTPRPGETITCKVEHASLVEPGLYDWGKRVTGGVLGLQSVVINKILTEKSSFEQSYGRRLLIFINVQYVNLMQCL